MFDCQTILSLHTHTRIHTGNIDSHLSRGRMISPTLLFHLFTHNYQTAKGSLPLSLNWNSKVCNYSNQQRCVHNNPTQATLSAHTLWTSIHTLSRVVTAWKIGTVVMDGRTLSRPLVIISSALRNPHFLLHTDPVLPLSAPGRVQAFSHMGEAGSQLTRQINVCKHSRNRHFS